MSFLEVARQLREELEGERRLRVVRDPFDVARPTTGSGLGYAQAALVQEAERVRCAPQGERNHTLNVASFSLAQLVAGGELDEHEVVDALTGAARAAGLDDREIVATIRSGMTSGAQSPRTVPTSAPTVSGLELVGPTVPAESHETGETAAGQPTLLDRLRAALVNSAGLDAIPEPVPLIDNVLFMNSIAWLIGPPGNGKSFVALDLAGCVGTGTAWQTHQTRRGGVVYLVAEGLNGIRPRVRAWESSMGIAMEDVMFLPVAVQVANTAEWACLVELCAELKPSLVVIDTQARVTVGMEENSARDMGEFIHRVEQLRVATGGCVLIVHHQGRNGDHMRGSTAMEGAATTIIKVAKDDDLVTIECRKQKDATEFDPFNLRLIEHDSSAVLMIIENGTPQRTDTPATRRMLTDWWNSHETDWVSVTTLVDSKTVTKTTFHRMKKSLERANFLEATGEGASRRYRLTRKPDFL